jgi:hypothetical protein
MGVRGPGGDGRRLPWTKGAEPMPWNPENYEKFKAERFQPFEDAGERPLRICGALAMRPLLAMTLEAALRVLRSPAPAGNRAAQQ